VCALGYVCASGACKAGNGTACSGDACAPGQICDGGTCRGEPGETCAAGVCTSGSVCEGGTCYLDLQGACAGDGDCRAGLVCFDGKCLAPITGACTGDGDCTSAWCRGGACAPVTCQDQITYGEVPACEKTSGVCAGLDKPVERCQAGGAWAVCTTADYAAHDSDYSASPERDCDLLDNDCDARSDEGCARSVTLAFPSGGRVSPRATLAIGQALGGRVLDQTYPNFGPDVGWGICLVGAGP